MSAFICNPDWIFLNECHWLWCDQLSPKYMKKCNFETLSGSQMVHKLIGRESCWCYKWRSITSKQVFWGYRVQSSGKCSYISSFLMNWDKECYHFNGAFARELSVDLFPKTTVSSHSKCSSYILHLLRWSAQVGTLLTILWFFKLFTCCNHIFIIKAILLWKHAGNYLQLHCCTKKWVKYWRRKRRQLAD